MSDKFQNLTEAQKKELNTLTNAEDVLAFAAKLGITLTPEEAAELAGSLPDDNLELVAGGKQVYVAGPAREQASQDGRIEWVFCVNDAFFCTCGVSTHTYARGISFDKVNKNHSDCKCYSCGLTTPLISISKAWIP